MTLDATPPRSVAPSETLIAQWTASVNARFAEDECKVHRLMTLLNIGRNAVYRRLKGEIQWTLREYMDVCRDLQIPPIPKDWGAGTEVNRRGTNGLTAELADLLAIADEAQVTAVCRDTVPFWAAAEPLLNAVYVFLQDHWACGGFDADFDFGSAAAERAAAARQARLKLNELKKVSGFRLIAGPSPLCSFAGALRAMRRVELIDTEGARRIRNAGRGAIDAWVELLKEASGVELYVAQLLPTASCAVAVGIDTVRTYANFPGAGLIRVVELGQAAQIRQQANIALGRACRISLHGPNNFFRYQRELKRSWDEACA